LSQSLETKKVFVGGIYNWNVLTTKEMRVKGDHPRHNWADIDILDQNRYDSVIRVFETYNTNVISHRLGKGWHMMADMVPYELWLKIWTEIKPYCDPKWAPHTIRLTKKRDDEVFERPVYHRFSSDPQPWAKAVMSFICKAIRDENSDNIKKAMHHAGIDKYFQIAVYPVEIKV